MPRPAKNQTRVALVTGGAKRVGRAIVERLAEAGFDVAFTYHRSEREAKALVRKLQTKHGRIEAIQADLTTPQGVQDAIMGFIHRFDVIDVLVNNASLYKGSDSRTVRGKLAEFKLDFSLFMIHMWAPKTLSRYFARMLEYRRGHIVNMIDLLAERPWPYYLSYCATKAGLSNLTLGLARELAPEVTVNGIAPGVVEWPTDYPEAGKKKYLKRVPLGRAGSPIDVANLVHFLCTEGKYITGQIIRVDGGRSIT